MRYGFYGAVGTAGVCSAGAVGLAAAGGVGLGSVGAGLSRLTIPQLVNMTRGLPWSKLWGVGSDDALRALERLRRGERILPDGISKCALNAYREIAKRALSNPDKATEVQELRLKIIEELLRKGS